MRTTADTLSVVSDEQGRFAFTSVPRGIVQLVVQPAEQRRGRNWAVSGDPRTRNLTRRGRGLPNASY